MRIGRVGLLLWHWTDDPDEAEACSLAGVDRIGIDIDRIGKAERQKGHPSWISPHEIAHLAPIRRRLPRHCLFVRTNALHAGSAAEIMNCIAAGADLLMLPNFQSIEELTQYLSLVAGRAKVVPLVERRDALALISNFPALGIEEFHFGLNDLALDFGVSDRLALLLHPEIEAACKRARLAGLHFGVGGVSDPRSNALPVDPACVIAQHSRLRSTGAMLARSFWSPDRISKREHLTDAINAIKTVYEASKSLSSQDARQALVVALHKQT